MIRVLHTGDIHACEKHHKWVDKALAHLVEYARNNQIDAWVIAGDSFDSAISVHSPAYNMFLGHVLALARIAPGVILAGTPSHDRPGVLDPFKSLPTKYPILIADKPSQWLLQAGEWHEGGEISDNTCKNGDALFSFLPSLNKADPVAMEVGANKYAADILASFAESNQIAREGGIATVLVSHGTVTGSVTESNYALVSPDLEFTVETLFSANADVVMLGHIHAQQEWINGFQTIAYCGSLARLVHGDHADKGLLVWDITAGGVSIQKFITSPTRQLLEINFNGPPDMDELEELAAKADADSSVRVRWSIDQEFAHSIDKPAIRAMFAHCEKCKLEGTINPIQSVRAPGIGRAISLEEKMGYFVETTGDERSLEALMDRLGMLQTMSVDEVVERVIKHGK